MCADKEILVLSMDLGRHWVYDCHPLWFVLLLVLGKESITLKAENLNQVSNVSEIVSTATIRTDSISRLFKSLPVSFWNNFLV